MLDQAIGSGGASASASASAESNDRGPGGGHVAPSMLSAVGLCAVAVTQGLLPGAAAAAAAVKAGLSGASPSKQQPALSLAADPMKRRLMPLLMVLLSRADPQVRASFHMHAQQLPRLVHTRSTVDPSQIQHVYPLWRNHLLSDDFSYAPPCDVCTSL